MKKKKKKVKGKGQIKLDDMREISGANQVK